MEIRSFHLLDAQEYATIVHPTGKFVKGRKAKKTHDLYKGQRVKSENSKKHCKSKKLTKRREGRILQGLRAYSEEKSKEEIQEK